MSFCGFCHHHKRPMTYRFAKKKGCFDSKKQRGKEGCDRFQKYPEHEIWKQIEIKRMKKKLRKKSIEAA
jgi:hypothetical protein